MIFSFSDLLEALFPGSVGRTKKKKPISKFLFFWTEIKILTVVRLKKKKFLLTATVHCANYPLRTQLTVRGASEVGHPGCTDSSPLLFIPVVMKGDIVRK